MPSPVFLKKVFRKVPDAKGRVLDPFECGGMDVMESLRLYEESGVSKDLSEPGDEGCFWPYEASEGIYLVTGKKPRGGQGREPKHKVRPNRLSGL